VTWFKRWPFNGPSRARSHVSAATVVVIGLLAVYLAWTAEGHVQGWSTRLLADYATGRLEARLLTDVSAGDLDGQPGGQVGPLYEHLSALLDRARADGERSLIQANIYAPDGTVLFSGQPERVGRKVLPSRVPRLAGALAGTVNTRLLLLSQADDADLTGRYTEVLAIYSPSYRDGEVVAAAEVYADPMPIRLARLATWIVIVGPVTLGLLLYVRRRQVQQADQVERLIGEAFFDSLTGLANRALFRFRLQQAFHRAARRGELMVVMFLDLDRFKSINDTLGHAAGDQLLILVGERLLTSVRPEDTVSRLAGDEFTVLLEEVPSLDDACAVAQRILEAMRQPFVLAGQERTVHVSLGIAARTNGHLEPEDVLHEADLALYQAKEGGRDRYAVYRPGSPEPLSKAS
jgi:diguanylate cyclase (GGDEF)-like protein